MNLHGRRDPGVVRSLDALARQSAEMEGVEKRSLNLGDRVLVSTRNSVYCIRVLGGDRYAVTGGWFNRMGLAPAVLTIRGCTFGGRALHTGLVAARGLYLEFGNAVITTRIRRVELIRREEIQN
jgi:hypothetical protein